VLSTFDEFCIHQTPEPIRQPATSDRNAYDRWWFSGFAADGSLYFAVAMGRYPNRYVLDGGVTVAMDGQQVAFHASRLAPDDPAETSIGPLSLDVLEPMRAIRLTLDANESGIEMDLTFRARTSPVEEARATLRRDGMVHQDTTRFTQFGRWEGWLSVDGVRVDVRVGDVLATRDRSWGVRTLGESAGGRPGTATGVFWNWLPIHFDDRCLHAWRFDAPDGTNIQEECLVVPARDPDGPLPMNDPSVEHLAGWSHSFRFREGTRYIEGGEIVLTREDGSTTDVEIGTPLLRAWPTAIGYMHPEWGHGMWKGDLAFGHERWNLAEVDASKVRHQLVHAVAPVRMDGRSGVGIIEQTYLGPYTPYGFVGATGVAS
jgi:hypothetical protein